MENYDKILDCIYEYAIDNCLTLNKIESKINLNTLYKFIFNNTEFQLYESLKNRLNDYIFYNWDFLDKFKIKYGIENLYFIPNTNCMQKIFQEQINKSYKENNKFYLVFKSYLGHYSLLYIERQKGINYAYCFDSVYGSVKYKPSNDMIEVLKYNNSILLYPISERQCTDSGCFADALTIARDISVLDLNIVYMYESQKKNVIMPFLLTHIERYDTMKRLKEQLNKYECYNYIFIPKEEIELNLSVNIDNLHKCELFRETDDGYIIHINELFDKKVLESIIRTREGDDYNSYRYINDIDTINHDFVLVDFPQRDESLKIILEDIVLNEMEEDIEDKINLEFKSKLTQELIPILKYYNVYKSVDFGNTILYKNLNSVNQEFLNSKGFTKSTSK